MMTVLEMALRDVLARAGAAEPGLGPSASVPRGDPGGPARACTPSWPGETAAPRPRAPRRGRGGGLPARRADLLLRRRARGRRAHRHHRAQPHLLHALVPEVGRRGGRRSRGRSSSRPAATTEEAWARLLRREPQTIEWTEDDLRTLLDEEAAERQGAILREIGRRELMRFRIGLDGLVHRPARDGDGTTAVVTEADLPLVAGRRAPSPGSSSGRATPAATTAVVAVGAARGARPARGRGAGGRRRWPWASRSPPRRSCSTRSRASA